MMVFSLREIRRRAALRLTSPEPLLWASLAAHARSFAPRERPTAQQTNVALQSATQWRLAASEVERLGLPPHPDPPKNWDSLGVLDLILKALPQTAAILDAGAEAYSPLLLWLYWYGYRDLHGINLVFDRAFKRGSIRYVPGDITASPYPSGRFDAITCLSVIEHGVDLRAFMSESHRLLRPHGLLILSCDYHAEGTDTAGQTAYGVPVRVFDRADMEAFIAMAAELGFEPTSAIDLTCSDRPVRWERLEVSFTFLLLSFRKSARA